MKANDLINPPASTVWTLMSGFLARGESTETAFVHAMHAISEVEELVKDGASCHDDGVRLSVTPSGDHLLLTRDGKSARLR